MVGNLRVRLLKMPEGRPITETFTRPDGQFTFKQLPTGDYVVETFETEKFEPTATSVPLFPPNPAAPTSQHAVILVDLSLKPLPGRVAPGVVAADIDIDVPKAALKHYREGMKALSGSDSARAVNEFGEAIKLYPKYYAARLELARELRLQKRFPEAEEALRPLKQIAPKQSEPYIERGIVLLAQGKRGEAADELRVAVQLEETSWAAHLYLGWALLETDGARAEPHFKRALELDEGKAARAHLALARLAQEKGQRGLAVEHLDAYVALAPEASDAEAARKLAGSLRSPD
jgi:tetratricopeptide (TPR) repeat protein